MGGSQSVRDESTSGLIRPDSAPTVAPCPLTPTILATSGGIGPGVSTRLEFTALTDLAIDLSGVTWPRTADLLLATAMGDDKSVLAAT